MSVKLQKTIIICKFKAVPGLAEKLLDTGDCLIAEATIRDRFWGIGININDPNIAYPSKWLGNNILGWALMEARDLLRNNNRY